jgi:hypothetical protein
MSKGVGLRVEITSPPVGFVLSAEADLGGDSLERR